MESNLYLGGDLSYQEIVLKLLNGADISTSIVSDIEDSDLVYWVYGKGPNLLKHFRLWILPNKLIIVHWIGTDVLSHLDKIKSPNLKSKIYHKLWTKLINYKVSNKKLINLACAPWLVDELMEGGIPAEYIPLTTINQNRSSNFTEKTRHYDFVSYLPNSRFGFYNGPLLLEIAKTLSDNTFLFIIPDISNTSEFPLDPIHSNITILPKVEHNVMKDIYRNSKIFLRFTKHDGMSLSVIEALSHRMQVYWTYKLPYTNYAKVANVRLISDQLRLAIKNWEPNFDGQDFIYKEFNINEITKRFKAILVNYI